MVPELTVFNFNASLDFYTRVLGFKIVNQRNNPSFAYLDLDGVQLMLEQDSEHVWKTGHLEKPLGRGINFQIEVEDIQKVYKSVLAEKIGLFRNLKESWYKTGEEEESGQVEFLVKDPDGYLLRFMNHLGERSIL